MLFTPEYSMKMPFGDTLLTALVGITTVICILAIIALLIILVSKIIRAIEGIASGKKKTNENTAPDKVKTVSGTPLPETESQGELSLVGVDEPTAAVIMAIVSDKSGIPLNRLCFKSIKLTEGENK